MQEYNSPEEYIKDVQRYIRWSRAKVVATRELSDHINDQYDALRENGLNQKEAMRKAIEEMGDADVVGTELDIVHRPKVNWLLLLIAGVLLLSGILISAMLTSISLTVPKIIGIVLGVCVAAFLYFIDKTSIKQIPICRTEYSVHSRLVFKRNQAAISILKEVFAMNETDYNARLL